MIKAIEVKKSEEQVLFNLLQKYLYELSACYHDKMDDNGIFAYPYLPSYFTDNDRQAFFFYDDDVMVGFALVNRHSFTGETVDNCIAEFTIFPAYRRGGKGMEAVAALKAVRKGTWQLKYSVTNIAGASFWQKVKEKYGGQEQKLEGSEIAVCF